MKPILAIVGMGEGIALAVVRRFGREGFAIAMVARNQTNLQQFQKLLQSEGYDAHYFVADAGNETSLKSAVASIQETLGNPEVLIYNAAVAKMNGILNETADSLTNDFKVNVAGALTAVQAVLPAMQAQAKGTIVFTGGGFALYPSPDFGSLSIGKAGIRSLGQMLAEALKPSGIRAGVITVAGMVSPEDPKYNPESIAEAYWAFHVAPQSESEVMY
jgi:NADP-dependent 3-hydroxy acid dehydrogenase YdfG